MAGEKYSYGIAYEKRRRIVESRDAEIADLRAKLQTCEDLRDSLYGDLSALRAQLAERDAEVSRLREAARDALSGWIYIRGTHGDLYGVGWDRVQDKLEAALQGEG